MTDRPQKILCIRLSAIGDVVVCTPVFRALAQQLKAEVHVLTKPIPAQMLASNSHVSKVIHWQQGGVVAQLKAENYDVIVDLHCNLRSHRLRLALGVPALGYRKRNLAKRLLTTGIDWLGEEHILDRYFKALVPLGVNYDLGGLDYFTEKELKFDCQSESKLQEVLPKGYIALVLGATHATKRMPASLLADLCTQAKDQVVLLGGKDVQTLATETLSKLDPSIKSRITNLCGVISLRQSAKLIEQANGVITPDTGLMHIAAALHKPMVVVWGNTVPAYGMYPVLPEGQKELAQFANVENLTCRPCSRIGYRECPKGHFKCMREQSATTILKQLEKSRRARTKESLAS